MTSPRQRRETILVVDDAPAVLLFVTDALEQEGYTVLSTGDPDEALTWVRTRAEPIHLLIADVAMSLMSGPELARQLRSIHSNVKVLFMSGSTAEEVHARGIRIGDGESCLAIPFSVAQLRRKVSATLHRAPPWQRGYLS